MILQDWQDQIVRRVYSGTDTEDGKKVLELGYEWAEYYYDVIDDQLGQYTVHWGRKLPKYGEE